MTTTNEIALPADTTNGGGDKGTGGVARYIASLQPEIARALPRGMDADRVARLALTLVRQSDIQARRDGKPENSLAWCTPESFAGALLTTSALGLEPGINGEAWLVPYKRECTFIAGYQGLAKLFWQHPRAEYLDAHAVYEGDEFDYEYGLSQFLHHKPRKGDRGSVIYYWAAARMANTAARFVVLTPEEVKALRGGKVGPSGKIIDPQLWMERKTAVRQLLKLVPKSTTLGAAIAVDEQRGSVLAARGVPSAIAGNEPIPVLPPTHEEEVPAEAPVTAEEITARRAARPAPVTEPAPEPAQASQRVPERPISGPLAKEVVDKLALCGLVDKDAVLSTISAMVGHPVTATMNLTRIEGDRLVGTLDACLADADGPEASLAAHLVELQRAADEGKP